MARNPQPLPHRNQNPAYAQLVDEIGKLQGALVPVRGRISEIEILLSTPTEPDKRTDGRVEAALHFVETGTVRRSENSDSLHEDHLRLREQAEALQEVIDRKQQALYQLESQLSSDALARSKDDFADIRDRYVAKLRELDAIAGEEQALLNSLNAQGYYPSLTRPVAWALIGVLSDPQSAISAHVRDLVRR